MEPIVTITPVVEASPTAVVEVAATAYNGWTDAQYVMQGVCFEAAEQLIGQAYSIRNSAELEQFYSQIDRTGLCEEPIRRETATFNVGDVLAGIWSAADGCTAEHEVTGVERDTAKQQIAIQLQLVVNGDCPYELIRPFWAMINEGDGYSVEINVIRPS